MAFVISNSSVCDPVYMIHSNELMEVEICCSQCLVIIACLLFIEPFKFTRWIVQKQTPNPFYLLYLAAGLSNGSFAGEFLITFCNHPSH